jgi:hypothetical protein
MTKVIITSYYKLLNQVERRSKLAVFSEDGGCPWLGLTSEDLLSASA